MLNLTLLTLLLWSQDSKTIEWARDLDEGLAQSKKDGRPVITYWTFET